MKFRVLTLVASLMIAGSLSAQTMTDVINEFNLGVEKLNNQEYEVSIGHLNKTIELSDAVGAEADDMKAKAQEQIPKVYYRMGQQFMKRKKFANAIPNMEKTIEFATLYDNNADIKAKAEKYLPSLNMAEGQRLLKTKDYDGALEYFNTSLEQNPKLYKAEFGKAMAYMGLNEEADMKEAFARASAGAEAKGDTKTLGQINGAMNNYYNRAINEEMSMLDPEEVDYTYVLEACDNALAANPNNPHALFILASIANKEDRHYDAIELAGKAAKYETDAMKLSGIYYELGLGLDKTSQYDKACEAYQQVTEDPYLTMAEKKMVDICD